MEHAPLKIIKNPIGNEPIIFFHVETTAFPTIP